MAIVIKRKAAPAPIEPVVPRTPAIQAPAHVDSMCLHVIQNSPNAAIAWWLMASYLYYVHDVSLLSDGLYDQMAKAMLEAWDELEHMHKHLITVEDLKAGSLYALPSAKYPNMVKGAAAQVIRVEMGIKIDVEK